MFSFAVAAIVLTGVVHPGHTLRMHTSTSFGRTEVLRVHVYVDNRELDPGENGACAAYYYRRGVVVRFAACGRGPLRVTATGIRRATVKVRIKRVD